MKFYYSKEVEQRRILEDMKSKYALTEDEVEAIDYAIFLIQDEIDGDAE